MTFRVSGDQRITTLTLGYAFGGCLGSVTIPADVPLLRTSRGGAATVVFSDRPPGSLRVVVRFLFPSTRTANGTAEITNDPACGSGSTTWAATR